MFGYLPFCIFVSHGLVLLLFSSSSLREIFGLIFAVLYFIALELSQSFSSFVVIFLFLFKRFLGWPFAILNFHSSYSIVRASPDHPSFVVFFFSE